MKDLHCCVTVKRMGLIDQGPFSCPSLRNPPGACPEQMVLVLHQTSSNSKGCVAFWCSKYELTYLQYQTGMAVFRQFNALEVM